MRGAFPNGCHWARVASVLLLGAASEERCLEQPTGQPSHQNPHPAARTARTNPLNLLQTATGQNRAVLTQLAEHGLAADQHPTHAACLGYGASLDRHACLATSPSGSSGGAWQSSSTCQTISVKVPRPIGCSTQPCWMQQFRIAVDSGNTLASGVRAGVYTDTGSLLASSSVVQISPGLGTDTWVTIRLTGKSNELHATEASGDLWLAVQFQQRVKIVLDAVPEAEAARVANEDWEGGLAAVRHWSGEAGRRVWSSTYRAPRVQLFIGDITSLPGVLPLLIEAPHGGRIEEGWPTRSSGRLFSDTNTDVISEALWSEFALRCGGRHPRAVILRVHRQGSDANRAVGNGTRTRAGTLCDDESGGECCCDIAGQSAQERAMDLAEAYQAEVLSALHDAGPGSFILSMHGTARHRVEVGTRLSGSRLNTAAARQPPSLDSSDWHQSTFRALGPPEAQAELTWGATSLGARLAETNPGLEMIPAPGLLCPDPNICPNSSSTSFFAGGHVLKISTNDTQPGVQVELDPSLRNRDGDGVPLAVATRRVAAGVAAFLNQHWPTLGDSCNADVNFGVNCTGHGQPHLGGCSCDQGYAGESCEACDVGYVQQPDQSCASVGFLGVPAADLDSEKHAWAYRLSSSGKQYMYWRRSNLQTLDCGAQGCPVLSMRVKIHCDSQACDDRVSDSSYQMGGAIYSADGQKLCEELSNMLSGRADTDWWLDVPLSCPTLTAMSQNSQHIYMAFWFTKKLRLRWEDEQPVIERAHSCTYDEDEFDSDPNSQSADGCVDRVPPAALPSWRDQACEDLPTWKCKSWTSSGVRNYYGPMLQLIYGKA